MRAAGPVDHDIPFDAVVLAGGGATRLGGADKPGLDVGGRSLLAHVVAAVVTASTVVVVGPQRSLDLEVSWCREAPPGGGPVAGLAAGLDRTSAEVVLVLAADLPWIAPAVPRLVAAVPEDGLAALVDDTGRVNHLAAAWRRSTLQRRLAALPTVAGAAMRALAEGVDLVPVADTGRWGTDCDTWADVERARVRAAPS